MWERAGVGRCQALTRGTADADVVDDALGIARAVRAAGAATVEAVIAATVALDDAEAAVAVAGEIREQRAAIDLGADGALPGGV